MRTTQPKAILHHYAGGQVCPDHAQAGRMSGSGNKETRAIDCHQVFTDLGERENTTSAMSELGKVEERLGIDMDLYHMPCKAKSGFGFRHTTGGTPATHACGDRTAVKEAGSPYPLGSGSSRKT